MPHDEEDPPRHLGDYPDGAYWSAEPPPGHTDDDVLDVDVEGRLLRFMWDYGVVVPLWDGSGLLPDEPAWLRARLGLSDELIDDLRVWGTEMDRLDANPQLRTEDAYRALDRRARALVRRLRAEVGPRGFVVTYQPW